MSRIVIVEKNREGKIELTKDELQKTLDDAYHQGYADGISKYSTITYPSYPVWYNTTECDTANCDKIKVGANQIFAIEKE